MGLFVAKAKATQQAKSLEAEKTGRSDLEHSHERSSGLHAQSALGNQDLQRRSQNDAEKSNVAFANTASPHFAHDFSRIPLRRPIPGSIQMKPAINQPGDEYEQEADIVAERVMRMSGPQGNPVGPSDGDSANSRASHPSARHERLQAKSVRASDTGHAAAPSIAYDVLRSQGQPLDSGTRTFFESRFGHDFSSVRVHVGAGPAQAARVIGARAYTLGQDIAFGHGEYVPGSPAGARLLAHELTHVVQQRQSISRQGSTEPVGAVIQRQDATPAPAEQAEAPVETEGDKLRRAILEAAERRLKEKTTIVSEAEIKDVREGRIRLRLVTLPDDTQVEMNIPTATPVKNFTTCIEFAGQTFGDASKVMGKNAKDSQRIASLLPGILKIFNEEFNLNAQIEAFQKAVMMFNKPIGDVRGRQAGFEDKKKVLREQKTGEKLHDKGIDQVIKGQDQAIRQLDGAIAAMEREQKKFEAKVKKLRGDYAVLDAQDDALIRATMPLNGRPKPGEYVLLGAGAKQAYGVSTATKVSLAKGSFKHIAVFKSSEPAPSPKDKPDEKWEKWQTIDGGGIEAKATSIFVCLSDLRVQFANYDQPWASSNTSLIGWIDMDKLIAGNAVKKDGAAPTTP